MKLKSGRLLSWILVSVLLGADVCAFAEAVASLVLPQALKIIEEEAFYGVDSIGKVVLFDDVTEIHSKAFANSSLTEINLPSSIEYIADDVFDGCGDIAVTAEEESYAYDWAVENKFITPEPTPVPSYTPVVTPEPPPQETPAEYFNYSVKDNGVEITKYTGTNPDVVIPAKIEGSPVIGIGNNAFSNVSGLKTVVIPDGVTYIGNYAFYGRGSLTRVDIPDSVASIGNAAFAQCGMLTGINLPAALTSISDSAFTACKSLVSIDIPEGVTSIGADAFSSCTRLTSVDLPESLTTISQYAFSGCEALKSISLPENLTSLGAGAFRECINLRKIVIPDGITEIKDYTFMSCDDLKSVSIPDSVTTIGQQAFYYCYAMESIDLPSRLISIGNYAFAECSSLLEIVFPDTLTSIGNSAFSGCYSLSTLDIPGSVKTISRAAFQNSSGFSRIILNENTQTIGPYAFDGCLIDAIAIPKSVTSIDSTAFNYKSWITIYGSTGSTAESFAKAQGIAFKSTAVPDILVSMWGEIYDENRVEVPGVSIQIYADREMTQLKVQLTSDEYGCWDWDEAILDDTYWIHFQKEGYFFSRNDFSVEAKYSLNPVDNIQALTTNPETSILSLSAAAWNADAAAGAKLLRVESSEDWYIASAPAWLRVYGYTGDGAVPASIEELEEGEEELVALQPEIFASAAGLSVSQSSGISSTEILVSLLENDTGEERSENLVIASGEERRSLLITQAAASGENGKLNRFAIANSAPYAVGQTISLEIDASPFLDGVIRVENANLEGGSEVYHFTDRNTRFEYLLKYAGDYTISAMLTTNALLDDENIDTFLCSDFDSISITVAENTADWGGMAPSDKLIQFLKDYEGFLATHDINTGNGNYVIGHGHEYTNLSDFEEPISRETADAVMRSDLMRFARSVNKFADTYGISFTQNQFDAMVSYAYNFGDAGFLVDGKYRYIFMKLMIEYADDLSLMPLDAFCRSLVSVNGSSSPNTKLGLFRRRMDEAEIFCIGDYRRDYPSAPAWLDFSTTSGSNPPVDWGPEFLLVNYVQPSSASLDFFFEEYNSALVTIYSSGKWTASTDSSWISIVTNEGKNGSNLCFDLQSNEDDIDRTGRITVSCGTGSAVIEVIQRAEYIGPVTFTAEQASETFYTGLPVRFRLKASGGNGMYNYEYALYDRNNYFSTLPIDVGTVDQESYNAYDFDFDLGNLPVGNYKLVIACEEEGGFESVLKIVYFDVYMQDLNIVQPSNGGGLDYASAFKIDWDGVEGADSYTLRIRDLDSGDLLIGKEDGSGLDFPAYTTDYIFTDLETLSGLRGDQLRIWIGAYKDDVRIAQDEIVVVVGPIDDISIQMAEKDESSLEHSFSWATGSVSVNRYEISLRDLRTQELIYNHQIVDADSPNLSFTGVHGHNYCLWVGGYSSTHVLIAHGQITFGNGVDAEGNEIVSVLMPLLMPGTIFNNFGKYNDNQEFSDTVSLPKSHKGNDMGAKNGSAVISVRSGTVTKITNDKNADGVGGGYYVQIQDSQYSKLSFRYMHLSDNKIVKVGDEVEAGQLIGFSGDSGSKGSYHLHMDVPLSGVDNVFLNVNRDNTGKVFSAAAYKFLNSVSHDSRFFDTVEEMQERIKPYNAGYRIEYVDVNRVNKPLYIQCKLPVNLTVGKTSWSVRGLISSSSLISSVTLSIEDAAGNAVVPAVSANPNSYMFDMHALDNLKFSALQNEGTYYYCINATDASGASISERVAFTVSAAAAAEKMETFNS